ncbi:MAG: serine hydrolase, partial [Rhodothermales bacterium]|nr:serine hydrolase [Rhodothermales bacterium]
ERVLGPLGLNDTAVTLGADQQARLAPGHSGGRVVSNWTFASLGAAGALRSSGAELLRFIRANLGLIETPLADELAATRAVRAPTAEDSLAVALGWHVRTTPNAEVFAHGGGTGGYKSFIGIDPEARRGAVVLTNTTTDLNDVGLHLLDPAVPLTPPVEMVDVPEETLAQYVGEYVLALGFTITVTRQGDRLYGQATGQPAFRLYPSSETEFFIRPVDARITFRVDEAGAVEGLTLHQIGRDMPAPKVQ